MKVQTKVKRLVAALWITCIVAIGCSRNDEKEISATSIGQITSVTPAVVNYTEGAWMNVATESAVVCISPSEPIYLGKTAYIRVFASGKQFLSWEGSKYMYSVGK